MANLGLGFVIGIVSAWLQIKKRRTLRIGTVPIIIILALAITIADQETSNVENRNRANYYHPRTRDHDDSWCSFLQTVACRYN